MSDFDGMTIGTLGGKTPEQWVKSMDSSRRKHEERTRMISGPLGGLATDNAADLDPKETKLEPAPERPDTYNLTVDL